MSNENYLDKVYTVGVSDPDQHDNSSGDDTDRDPRRGGQEFYDAISDPAALRNAMDLGGFNSNSNSAAVC